MRTLKILDKTPASLGYTFPPEWAPHRATWFSWPRPEGISFPDKYHTVPENLAGVFKEIAPRSGFPTCILSVVTDSRAQYWKPFQQLMASEGKRVEVKDDSDVKFFLVTVE